MCCMCALSSVYTGFLMLWLHYNNPSTQLQLLRTLSLSVCADTLLRKFQIATIVSICQHTVLYTIAGIQIAYF